MYTSRNIAVNFKYKIWHGPHISNYNIYPFFSIEFRFFVPVQVKIIYKYR